MCSSQVTVGDHILTVFHALITDLLIRTSLRGYDTFLNTLNQNDPTTYVLINTPSPLGLQPSGDHLVQIVFHMGDPQTLAPEVTPTLV